MAIAMRYVTAAQMKEIDRHAIEESGIPAAALMENAGKAVAGEAEKVLERGKEGKGQGGNKREVLIFCGYGNNGGDGLVAARHLAKRGHDVKVFFAGSAKSLTPETNSNLERLFPLKINPQFISNETEAEKIFSKIKRPDVVIDAIFGIGLKGPLDNFYVDLIERIGSLCAPIISADIPSGLDADTGKPLPVAIKAASTVTFGFPKAGFKNKEAEGYIGKLIIADIGLRGEEEEKGGEEVRRAENRVEGKNGEDKGREGVIRVRSGKKGRTRPGYPWIFKSQILKADPAIKPGDIITLHDSQNKFIGRGYYNPRSEICVRLLTFNDEEIDKKLIHRKIQDAAAKRKGLLAITNAYRVIFSEADGLPGLIVDIYNDTVVFQALTLGIDKLKTLLVESMRAILKPKYIYEKSVSPFRKLEGLKDVAEWRGEKGNTPIEIFEGKAKFLVDIENGHKTGFYLDQRKSRMGLEGFCKDKTVLDLFCYTGGFAINAGIFGSRSVTGVDVKEDWLELARENARLNGIADKAEFIKADAFRVLKEISDSGRRFDIIIIDPPSFLKSRESLASASKGYRELNTAAMKILNEGGMLATFSCSHNMPNAAFSEILKRSAAEAGKKIAILKRCHQAEDHPIVRAIPETEYLKGYFLKVGNQ